MDIACFQHMRILHLLHFTKMHKRPLGVFAELQNANPLLPFAQLIATALIAIVHSVPVYAGLAITFPLSVILWVRHAGKRR